MANLSLSSKSETLFPFFHEAVDAAYFRNVHLVSAANNVPGLSFPSLFSTVYSVAAHAIPDPELVYYNPRPPVEFGAWGVDVPIAWKDGGTTVATGNSFAAPHIAGLVCRVLSVHPGLTSFEVKARPGGDRDDPPGVGRRSATPTWSGDSQLDGEPSGLGVPGPAGTGASPAGRMEDGRQIGRVAPAREARRPDLLALVAGFLLACVLARLALDVLGACPGHVGRGARVQEHRLALGVVPLIGRTHRLFVRSRDSSCRSWGSPGSMRGLVPAAQARRSAPSRQRAI